MTSYLWAEMAKHVEEAARDGIYQDDRFAPKVLIWPARHSWINTDFRHNPQPQGSGHEGWKLHISMPYADLPKAWDAVLPVLQEQGFKAKMPLPVLQDRLEDPNNPQAGKMLVLYFSSHHPGTTNDDTRATALLTDLEQRLRRAQVRPGWAIEGDKPVEGSGYLYVRNDLDLRGRYMANSGRFNPFGHQGSLALASVNVQEALPDFAYDPNAQTAQHLRLATQTPWHKTSKGWQPQEDHPDMAKILKAGGAVVETHHGKTLAKTAPTDWHKTLSVWHAAQMGRSLKEALQEPKGRVRVLPAGTHVRLENLSPKALQQIKTLAQNPRLGEHTIEIQDQAAVLSYGGALHIHGMTPSARDWSFLPKQAHLERD